MRFTVLPALRSLPIAFATALPFAALAQTADSPGISAGSYLQAMAALIFIVALLAGTAWLARKVTGGKGFGQGGMRIVGGVALGPRERIVLVEAGDTWLVIGIVPGQIRTLHTMPKGHLPSEGLPAPGDKNFAQWLKQIAERRNRE